MTDQYQLATWLKYDARTQLFTEAIQYVNWERVEGDILEFGVAVGKSLALLSQLQQENLYYWQYKDRAVLERRVVGFDSFEGLPADDVRHPRWHEGSFKTNYLSDHPVMNYDESITPEAILRLFRAAELPTPELEVGLFGEVLTRVVGNRYHKAALVHIDSDLYQSAKEVLDHVEPMLQDGTIILFDDWFMYRGNPNKGEARAFNEFLDENPQWQAIHYKAYSCFCNSFIMHRRDAS